MVDVLGAERSNPSPNLDGADASFTYREDEISRVES